MANNRVYLRCSVCEKDALALGKWYPSVGWYSNKVSIEMTPWLEQHTDCALEDQDGRCFSLVYESDVEGAPLALYPSKQGQENAA